MIDKRIAQQIFDKMSVQDATDICLDIIELKKIDIAHFHNAWLRRKEDAGTTQRQ